jgi:hypothetical protein
MSAVGEGEFTVEKKFRHAKQTDREMLKRDPVVRAFCGFECKVLA